VGNAMPVLAMAWVLSGEKQYLEAARQWALASCGYRTWGVGRIDGMDLAAGHQLLGLGLVYDWYIRMAVQPPSIAWKQGTAAWFCVTGMDPIGATTSERVMFGFTTI
jgi:hypothetical protein